MINLAAVGAIQESRLNKRKNLNVFQKTENINIALAGAKSIGCVVINIGAQDILDGRYHFSHDTFTRHYEQTSISLSLVVQA